MSTTDCRSCFHRAQESLGATRQESAPALRPFSLLPFLSLVKQMQCIRAAALYTKPCTMGKRRVKLMIQDEWKKHKKVKLSSNTSVITNTPKQDPERCTDSKENDHKIKGCSQLGESGKASSARGRDPPPPPAPPDLLACCCLLPSSLPVPSVILWRTHILIQIDA